MSIEPAKLLDAWIAPPDSGPPVACMASTFTFEPGFFDEQCLARFLGNDTAVVAGGDEIDTLVYVLEREERLGDVRTTVLVDRAHAAAPPTFRWDVVPVQGERGGVQHAKVTFLIWENHVRLIVASANLTEPGYRSNVEVFSVLDDDDAQVPDAVFLDAASFLAALVRGFTAGDDGDNSPRGRAMDTIDLVRRHIRSRGVGEARGGPRVRFLHTVGRGDLLERAFSEVWRDRSRPTHYVATSPFFDRESDAALVALAGELARRGEVSGEIGVVTVDAGEDQLKLHAPQHLEQLKFRGAPELASWPPEGEDGERNLHAKCFLYESGNRVMLITGSANATSAGLGLGTVGNIEAVIAVSARTGTAAGTALTRFMPELESLPPDKRWIFEPPPPEDEEGPRALPSGFVEALYEPGKRRLVVTVAPAELPPTWRLRHGEDLWWDQGAVAGGQTTLTRELGDSNAPKHLTAEWQEADDENEHAADFIVSVADAAELPEPPEIAKLTLEELLDLLAVGGRLHDLLRRLVRRRSSGDALADDAPPELDPHRRVDTSEFMLQRTRRVAYALEGLQRKLNQPLAHRDALERRLRGPFGPVGLAAAAEKAVKDGRMSERERTFMLAEVALVLGRTEWKPAPGTVRIKECRAAARRVAKELRPKKCGDPVLDKYVSTAFAEVSE